MQTICFNQKNETPPPLPRLVVLVSYVLFYLKSILTYFQLCTYMLKPIARAYITIYIFKNK